MPAKAFEHLSYRGQIPRLRKLAETAVTHYGLCNARIDLLTHRENTTFRVTVPPQTEHTKDIGGTKFVLRVYGPVAPSPTMIRSELLWLAAIRRDTDLVVPEPVPDQNDSLLTEVSVEGIPKPRLCILFHWVDGRFIYAGLTPARLEQVGAFMGRLHQHGQQFVPPTDFVRPHVDWRRVFGQGTVADPAFVAEKGNRLISESDITLFASTAEKVRAEMQVIPRDAENYGLIHGDFQQTNYLFHRGEIRVIDFAECGWGYYLFDIAKALSRFEIEDGGRPPNPAMRDAFFKGYERIRPLRRTYEQHLKTFLAIRFMLRINYLLRSDNPHIQAEARVWIPRFVDWLKRFLDA